MMDQKPAICLVPQLCGVGGMVSFQAKLAAGLRQRGHQVFIGHIDPSCEAVLVIGGTRHLRELGSARKKGIRVIQRLDGMNWLHRLKSTGAAPYKRLKHYLRSEYGNLLLNLIRKRYADEIIYQSQFSKTWWESARGETPRVPSSIIYNGVDLSRYTPGGSSELPGDRVRILMVEGSLMGGYESGLETGVALAQGVSDKLKANDDRPVELMIVGRVSEKERLSWEYRLANRPNDSQLVITWRGQVQPEEIPGIDRSAHILYSSDINAACPNSVIEALACGLPVLSFDTGALPEIVTGSAGKVIPYGGDPWKLEDPDVDGLVNGALAILSDLPAYRQAARHRAQAAFSLDQMVDRYLVKLCP